MNNSMLKQNITHYCCISSRFIRVFLFLRHIISMPDRIIVCYWQSQITGIIVIRKQELTVELLKICALCFR